MRFIEILKSKRGDVGYIQMAVTLLVTVVIGAMLFGGAQVIVKNQLRPKLAEEFGATERDTAKFDTIIRDYESDKEVIPEGALYYPCISVTDSGFVYDEPLTGGQIFPDANVGDKMEYGDYVYYYGADPDISNALGNIKPAATPNTEWGVLAKSNKSEEYGAILATVNRLPVTKMDYTFYGCKFMKKAPEIPTGVKDMTKTFANCGGMRTYVGSMDSDWDFSNYKIPDSVVNMNGTFDSCWFNVAPSIPNSVTNMSYLFHNCMYLQVLSEISSNAEDMSYAFSGCKVLTSTPVVPKSAINMEYTFQNCNSITEAPVFPDGVENLKGVLEGCSAIDTAPLIPSSVTNIECAFNGCTSISRYPGIDNSYSDFSNYKLPGGITSLRYTFAGCKYLYAAPQIPDSVTNMYGTFKDCTGLWEAPTIPDGVTDMYYTFCGCKNLSQYEGCDGDAYGDFGGYQLPRRLVNMAYTFYNCTALTRGPVIPNGVTDMFMTFYKCSFLKTAPEIPDGVTNMQATFANCTSLTTVSRIPSSVLNMDTTFYGCSALKGAIQFNASPEEYANCFASTTRPIRLYATAENEALLAEIAKTSSNGNVTVVPPGTIYFEDFG